MALQPWPSAPLTCTLSTFCRVHSCTPLPWHMEGAQPCQGQGCEEGDWTWRCWGEWRTWAWRWVEPYHCLASHRVPIYIHICQYHVHLRVYLQPMGGYTLGYFDQHFHCHLNPLGCYPSVTWTHVAGNGYVLGTGTDQLWDTLGLPVLLPTSGWEWCQ